MGKVKIYLIRHGQTDWNVEGRLQGWKDIPLNEEGRAQAGRLAERMESRPVSQIFTSPQKRAYETAKAVADRQNLPLVIIPELMEISYGVWEGKTGQEVFSTQEALYEEWENGGKGPEGSETLAQVYGRCKKAWEQVKSQLKGDCALVSHGSLLSCFLTVLLGDDPVLEYLVIPNASITTLSYDTESGKVELLEWNEVQG